MTVWSPTETERERERERKYDSMPRSDDPDARQIRACENLSLIATKFCEVWMWLARTCTKSTRMALQTSFLSPPWEVVLWPPWQSWKLNTMSSPAATSVDCSVRIDGQWVQTLIGLTQAAGFSGIWALKKARSWWPKQFERESSTTWGQASSLFFALLDWPKWPAFQRLHESCDIFTHNVWVAALISCPGGNVDATWYQAVET